MTSSTNSTLLFAIAPASSSAPSDTISSSSSSRLPKTSSSSASNNFSSSSLSSASDQSSTHFAKKQAKKDWIQAEKAWINRAISELESGRNDPRYEHKSVEWVAHEWNIGKDRLLEEMRKKGVKEDDDHLINRWDD